MYNVNDILARLQAGEDAEAIATEFTNSLNSAIEQDKARKAEAEAKRVEEAERNDKINKLTAILTAIDEYLEAYYPDLEIDFSASEEEIGELVDGIDELIEELASLSVLTGKFKGIKPTAIKPKVKKEDPILKFLHDNNLL